ncbi:hypothetical protein [Mycolicibacterium peregrinum]|uniref:hypothetical protein n=1 Tax=Mycolicibacterium peregrinum TaxID=43304 RepID=UPI000B4AE6BA|nr:hypothetical protein [Mycolicibacterium peregrinum]
MTTNSADAQPEDIVARLLGQATEILAPEHSPSERAINYARACAELAGAYAARASAISAATTAEAAQTTVGLLTQIQYALGALEEQRASNTR